MILVDYIFPHPYRDEAKVIIKNSLPLILTNFTQTFLPIISLFFCGHIGPNELAAVTIACTFINIFASSTTLGLATACDTLMPQFYGGVNKKKVGLVLQKGLLISVLSCFLSGSVLLNCKNIMALFMRDQKVIELADEFIIWYMPAILFYSIHNVLQKYLMAQNVFYPILITYIVSNGINLFSHAILVYYLRYGVVGAAISVAIANFSIMMFLSIYILLVLNHEPTWPGWSMKCFEDWKSYLRLAIPGFGMLLFEWANFEIGVIFSGTLGTIDVSIMAISIQTIYILFMIPFGIATATTIRIGQLLGENLPQQAKTTLKASFMLNSLISLISGSGIFIFSNHIPLAFTSDQEIIDRSASLLKFLSIVQIADAMQGYGAGIIRSIGAQLYGSIVIFTSLYIIGLPIGITLMLKTNLRVLGYWIGFFIAALLLILFQLILVLKIDWEKTADQVHKRSMETVVLVTNEDEAYDISKINRRSLVIKILFLVFFSSLFAASISARSYNINELVSNYIQPFL